MLFCKGGDAACKGALCFGVQRYKFRHARTKVEKSLHISEDTAADVGRDLFGKHVKGVKNAFGRIFFCKEDGLKAPHQPFAPDQGTQFDQRGNACFL